MRSDPQELAGCGWNSQKNRQLDLCLQASEDRMEALADRMEAHSRAFEERLETRPRAHEGRMQEQMEGYKSALVGLFERWTRDISLQTKGKGLLVLKRLSQLKPQGLARSI